MPTTAAQRVWRTLNSTQRYGHRFAVGWRRRLLPRGRCVLVAAMPKSGSSFLVKALAEATGFVEFYLGYDHLNEQDLYLPRLIDSWGIHIVTHQHLRVTRANIELLKEFGIRPVVLRRDLADALVSLADHLNKESLATHVLAVPAEYRSWPRQRQLQAVLDLAAPWYVQFLAGWRMAAAEVDALVVDYEDMIADPARTVADIMRHQGLLRTEPEIAAAVDRARGAGLRFNRGVAGRGATEFTPEQLARLNDLARHYPGLGALAPQPA